MNLPAVKVELGRGFSGLTPLTYFEIRGLCEAQNRGARPWLAPVPQQVDSSPHPEAAPIVKILLNLPKYQPTKKLKFYN